MIKEILILVLISLFPIFSYGNLANMQICLTERYKKLSDRNAIVAAVIDADSEVIMTFGKGFEKQIFEIGSVTKTFTALLLAHEVASKKIGLSDPIPAEYQKPGTTITYKHLTSHTSGIMPGIFHKFKITNEFFPYEGLTIPIFKRLYSETPLVSAPGAEWNYSNIGSALQGLILSEKSGSSYESLIRDRILKPIGMKDTYFQVPKSELSRFPKGIAVATNGTRRNTPHWDLYSTAINPAGGIRSTIRDMVLYARAHLVPELTSLREAAVMTRQPLHTIKNPDLLIGMNWILQPNHGLIWHNGQTYGFNSIIALSTKSKQGVVALTDTTVLKTTSTGEEVYDTSLQDVVFECLQATN